MFYVADNGTCDRPLDPTNQNQYIVWGVGSLGATAFQHHTRATSKFFKKFNNTQEIDVHNLG